MKIIGVVGKKRSGKDTVAAMLGAGVRRIAFADKLKHVAMQMFGLSFEQCYEAADQHASETSIDDIVEDYGISNNGTLDDLRSKVEGFARWYAERRS